MNRLNQARLLDLLSFPYTRLCIAFLFVTLLAGCASQKAREGYIYGFPLVLMGETKDGLTGDQRVCGLGADINTFSHIYERPGADFRAVVRPNVDTLYSTAMLDLSMGPMLLHMPAIDDDRYVLMAMIDAWSNNFAGPGTQETKNKEGRFFIVGPGWSGDSPKGYELIKAPTNLVWIIGRTEVRGEDDIPAVNQIQRQYELIPYQRQQQRTQIECVPPESKRPPEEVVKSMSAVEYFSRLSELMEENPAPAADTKVIKRLSQIGVGKDADKQVEDMSGWTKWALSRGKASAQVALDLAIGTLGYGKVWSPAPEKVALGDFEQNYFVRAVVSQIGFGANKGEYAVYQNAKRDESNHHLSGNHTYEITFPAGMLPPVDAFWSITAYNKEGYLTDNRAAKRLGIKRFAVGSNTGLTENEDGSVSIFIANRPPEGVALSNWLPVPEGRFEVTLRMYAPHKAIITGEWKAPNIRKLD